MPQRDHSSTLREKSLHDYVKLGHNSVGRASEKLSPASLTANTTCSGNTPAVVVAVCLIYAID
jgi:hypothetical protein